MYDVVSHPNHKNWIPCACGVYWCNTHNMHVTKCPCKRAEGETGRISLETASTVFGNMCENFDQNLDEEGKNHPDVKLQKRLWRECLSKLIMEAKSKTEKEI